jgi:hydrogenase maturation protease
MRHILCFGNPLHGDDGFGPAVYQKLTSIALPNDISLIDAGTPGVAALGLFQGCDEAIIVDVLPPCDAPGRLCELSPDSIMPEASLTGHGMGVGYLLQALSVLPEAPPRIRIFAVEAVEITAFRPGLSAPVLNAVDAAVTRLLNYLKAPCYG